MLMFIPIEDNSGKPKCAFLETVPGTFYSANANFRHVFESYYEVDDHPEANRFRAVTPPGFWRSKPQEWHLHTEEEHR